MRAELLSSIVGSELIIPLLKNKKKQQYKYVNYIYERKKSSNKSFKMVNLGVRNNWGLGWETATVTCLVEGFESLNHLHV